MASKAIRHIDARNALGSTPWGQTSVLRFLVKTNAIGAVLGAEPFGPVAAGDVVTIGTIPFGFRVIDSQLKVVKPLAGAVKAGFTYASKDPKTVAELPKDDEYFGAGLSVAAATRLRNASAKPSILSTVDLAVTLTFAAAQAAEGELEFLVICIAEGLDRPRD